MLDHNQEQKLKAHVEMERYAQMSRQEHLQNIGLSGFANSTLPSAAGQLTQFSPIEETVNSLENVIQSLEIRFGALASRLVQYSNQIQGTLNNAQTPKRSADCAFQSRLVQLLERVESVNTQISHQIDSLCI